MFVFLCCLFTASGCLLADVALQTGVRAYIYTVRIMHVQFKSQTTRYSTALTDTSSHCERSNFEFWLPAGSKPLNRSPKIVADNCIRETILHAKFGENLFAVDFWTTLRI